MCGLTSRVYIYKKIMSLDINTFGHLKNSIWLSLFQLIDKRCLRVIDYSTKKYSKRFLFFFKLRDLSHGELIQLNLFFPLRLFPHKTWLFSSILESNRVPSNYLGHTYQSLHLHVRIKYWHVVTFQFHNWVLPMEI